MTAVEDKKRENKESKKLSGDEASVGSQPADGTSSESTSLDLRMAIPLLLKGNRGRSLKSANSTYRVLVSQVANLLADGSGNFAGSLRFGDPSLWQGTSTWNALFQRFRVVHVSYVITRAPANASAGTTPSQSICYLDVGVTSVTPSLSGAFQAPNSRVYSDGAGYGFAPTILKPVLESQVLPEQDWFDITTQTQKGCLVVYTTGNTASVNAQTVFARYVVEFSGLLL